MVAYLEFCLQLESSVFPFCHDRVTETILVFPKYMKNLCIDLVKQHMIQKLNIIKIHLQTEQHNPAQKIPAFSLFK